jgi:hypothetical protein
MNTTPDTELTIIGALSSGGLGHWRRFGHRSLTVAALFRVYACKNESQS